jgi:hypothetical protein
LRAVLRRVVLLALQLVLLPAQHVRQVLAPVVRQALVLAQALAPVLQLLALNRFCR